MATFYISGSESNNNGGTIVALGNNIRNTFNGSSSSNIVINGGSVVINSNNTSTADISGTFAFNNNKPISFPYTNSLSGVDGKNITGNYPIINRSKTIRSTLTATAIRNNKYNYFNNTFNINYPENTSYDLCPDVATITYELGQKQPLAKNDNPSNCNQFDSPTTIAPTTPPTPEPTPEPTPAPTIASYVADSSFGAAEGTYCPAGTYGDSPYYAGQNSDGTSNGWLMYYDADMFGWTLAQTNTPGVDSSNGYSANGDPDKAPLTGWFGDTGIDLVLTTGNVCSN